jgi:CxxC-x17-CxxC domain-containing protein
MRDSNRNDRGGRRDFGGAGSNMHEAICAECGRTCQVPFRPSGDKPVYCSDCFAQKRGGDNQARPERRDFNRRPDFRDREKRMFSAICDKCGKACQVPFQPTEGKPVFCDNCFDKGGSAKGGQGNSKGGDLQALNAKLDKIINALIAAKIIKAEAKPAKVEEKKTAKTEVRKEVKAKAPTKKAAKKKK